MSQKSEEIHFNISYIVNFTFLKQRQIPVYV